MKCSACGGTGLAGGPSQLELGLIEPEKRVARCEEEVRKAREAAGKAEDDLIDRLLEIERG
ncbi:hypothetical protein IID24_03320 [Patescibacteria group bacterium]|nr:hypothetical protein [Patescibacteria group bacterium]